MDLASLIHSLMGTSQNAQRKKLEQQLKAAQKKDPAGFCKFAVRNASSEAPDVAQFTAIAFKNFVEEQGRAAIDKIDGGSRDELLGHLQNLVTGGPAPREILLPLCVGYGSMLAVQYVQGHCPDLFGVIHQWIEAATDDGPSLTQPLLLLHQVLKAAAKHSVYAATFDPIFRQVSGTAVTILTRTSQVRGASADSHPACILATKIALRCATATSLNVDVVGLCVELSAEYCSAASAGELSDLMQIELTRIGKVVTAAVEKRCSALSDFGHEFASTSLLSFLTSSLSLPVRPDIPEKFVARALAALQTVLNAADSDEFVANCIGTFFSEDGMVASFVRELVTRFLADDDVSEDEWESEPERCVIAAETDPDADDAVHCAEQVFVSFLSAGKDSVVAAAWAVLGDLLMSNTESESIGALHAMGIGYDYLTEGQGESFRGFLESRLLPVAKGEMEASLKLRRRAIWMIGMWCILVEGTAERRTIFEALCHILQTASDPVICLTTWKTFENYISDDHFEPEQIDGLLGTLLESIGAVTPRLRDPDMIKFVAQLLDVTMQKTNPHMISYDSVIDLLAPILDQLVRKTIDEDDRSVAASASVLFEACAHAAAQSRNPVNTWNHLLDMCLFVTNPENTINIMADYEAWDTIKALAQCVTADVVPELYPRIVSTIRQCVSQCERDFDGLPKCVDAIAILCLALRETSQLNQEIAFPVADAVVGLLDGCENDELCTAIESVVEVIVLATGAEGAAFIFARALTAAANNAGSCVMAFNAAMGAASRCALVAPQVWLDHANGFGQYIDAVGEGYDEMTDPYQRRLIVNGAVLSFQFLSSHGVPIDDAAAGLLHQTWESETLQEAHQSKEEDYACMWGCDGAPTAHLARVHAIAAEDTMWTLLNM